MCPSQCPWRRPRFYIQVIGGFPLTREQCMFTNVEPSWVTGIDTICKFLKYVVFLTLSVTIQFSNVSLSWCVAGFKQKFPQISCVILICCFLLFFQGVASPTTTTDSHHTPPLVSLWPSVIPLSFIARHLSSLLLSTPPVPRPLFPVNPVCVSSHGSQQGQRSELTGPPQGDHGGERRSGQVGPHIAVHV